MDKTPLNGVQLWCCRKMSNYVIMQLAKGIMLFFGEISAMTGDKYLLQSPSEIKDGERQLRRKC